MSDGWDAGDEVADIDGEVDTGADGDGEIHIVTIDETMAGGRLDKVLAASVPGLTRSRVQALLDEGAVTADGATISDGAGRVKPGRVYVVAIPAAAPAEPVAQDIPLTIVFEDSDLLVIDKPAGMVVHPAAGNPDGTLVNALLAHCGADLSGIGGVRRPGIVHRLDKDTSGLIVVAKNDRAHRGLTEQFADRSLGRTYRCVVRGVPNPLAGTIDANIARSTADRKKMAVVGEGAGKTAITHYKVIARFGLGAALVECALATGRTHQIRVHMAHMGHPLVGDSVYGGVRGTRVGRERDAKRNKGVDAVTLSPEKRHALARFPRQALHAVEIHFRHPGTGERVSFNAPMPEDMRDLLRCLEAL